MRFSQGIIQTEKLEAYLFNPRHVQGWPKGRFLESIGFERRNLWVVASAFLDQASTGTMIATKTDYGTKLEIDGPITSPNGTEAQVRTVWHKADYETIPRFVTFKPLRKQS